MKNRKAFTIVELLAVLVILAVIMAITIPTISYFLRGNSKDYYSKLESTVSTSSQDFFNDYRVNLPKDIGNIKKINISTLTSQKYVTDILGTDKKNCEGDVVVQKLSNGNYSYTACLKCDKNKDGNYGYVSTAKECDYSEENNSHYTILIDGLGDKTSIRVPQATGYNIPNAKVYVNGQALSSVIKPTPISINTNILTTYKVYYTFRTLVKELQIKVYDPKKPTMANVTATTGGTNYTSGTFTNKDVKVNLSATDWTTSSVYGSGVDRFEYQINGGSVQKINATTSDNRNYTASFNLTTNGTHNISVKAIDKEGNISDSKTFVVKIDKTSPSGTITVASTNSNYKALTVKATLNASDNSGGSGVKQMCIQESNNVSSCNWVNYVLTRNLTLSGTLNGGTRTIYVWFKDGAGNISNVRSTTYTTYKEGTEVNLSGWSSCSKVCGGGTQTKTATDKYTGKAIVEKNQTQNCNTMDCCSSTTITGTGKCNKSCGGGTKPIYRKSNINGQNCSKSTETVSCNTMDCCSQVNYSDWSDWSPCSASCGGGSTFRTRTATSQYNGQACTGSNFNLKETKTCNTHSCFDPGNPSYDDLLDCNKVSQVFASPQGLKKVLENENMRKRVRNLGCTQNYGKTIYDTCKNNPDIFNIRTATTEDLQFNKDDHKYQYTSYANGYGFIHGRNSSSAKDTSKEVPQNNPMVYIVTGLGCGTASDGFIFSMYYSDDLNSPNGRYNERLTWFRNITCKDGYTSDIYAVLFGGGGTYYTDNRYATGSVSSFVCSPKIK